MCKSVFFLSKVINCCRTFEACYGLKSRGLGDLATLPVEKKLLKNFSEQAVLDKFFDAGHYVKNIPNTARQRPILRRGGVATMNGGCPSAKTMALKSGMTLTT